MKDYICYKKNNKIIENFYKGDRAKYNLISLFLPSCPPNTNSINGITFLNSLPPHCSNYYCSLTLNGNDKHWCDNKNKPTTFIDKIGSLTNSQMQDIQNNLMSTLGQVTPICKNGNLLDESSKDCQLQFCSKYISPTSVSKENDPFQFKCEFLKSADYSIVYIWTIYIWINTTI
jgi:hypothetical protein